MEFDEALNQVGKFPKYQILLFIPLGLAKIQNVFVTLGIVFIAGIPTHWCNTPELRHLNLTDDVVKNLTLPLVEKNGQSTFSSCTRYSYNYSGWTTEDVQEELSNRQTNISTESCSYGWVYDTERYTSTIVSEWNLVCDESWLRGTSTSIYMAGLMVGVIVFGSVSDIIGRRPTYIGCYLAGWIMAFVTSFSPNYIIFCVFRFFSAFFDIACFTTTFVLLTEITRPDYRSTLTIGTMMFWSVGFMLYPAIAYFLRDWFTLNIVSISVFFPLCIISCFISESPRWLYTKGQVAKGDALLRKIARVNGTTLPDDMHIRVTETKEKGYFWDIWRTRRMALRSAILCFLWFVVSCVYYGLSLNTSSLGGNDFVNFFISGAVEIPSNLLSMVATHYVGRRWPQCASFVLAGIPLICITAVPADYAWLTVTLAMIGKFGINTSLDIIYLYTAELYPTVVRNVGLGTGSFVAKIGGIVAPLINELNSYNRLIPLIVFGVLSLVAGLLTLVLPETKGTRLPETLDDGETFGRDRTVMNPIMKKAGVVEFQLNGDSEVKDTLLDKNV